MIVFLSSLSVVSPRALVNTDALKWRCSGGLRVCFLVFHRLPQGLGLNLSHGGAESGAFRKRRPLCLTPLGAIQKEQVTMDAPREEQSLVTFPIHRVIDALGWYKISLTVAFKEPAYRSVAFGRTWKGSSQEVLLWGWPAALQEEQNQPSATHAQYLAYPPLYYYRSEGENVLAILDS